MKKLDKKICQSCFRSKLKKLSWDKMDDARWKDGRLFCMASSNIVEINVIPEECRFSLEHIMATQEISKETE
jgi:hypothetical protein